MGTRASIAELRRLGLMAVLRQADSSPKQKVVIDYSSPNIAKRFHIGNLRSTLIGRFDAKLLSSLGHSVHSINYLGDWGRQMALIIAYWPKVRPSDSLWNETTDGERVRLLTDCYVVANQVMDNDEKFREEVRLLHDRMESIIMQKGPDAAELCEWRNIFDVSCRHLQHFYNLFHVHFDQWMRESAEVKRARDLIDGLVQQGVAVRQPDGMIVVPATKEDEDYSLLAKSDGTTLYLTRDVASLIKRHETIGADRYVYVVERAQRRHFIALKRVLEGMGRSDLASRVEHLMYGRVKGLSTRTGRTEAVSEILDSGKEMALEWMRSSPTRRELTKEEEDSVATRLATSSLIMTELRKARNREYEFSWRQTFEPSGGNNALFLHSKHSRLVSIEERNEGMREKAMESSPTEEEAARPLIEALLNLSVKAVESSSKRESNGFTNALLTLARESGRAGTSLRVLGEEEGVAARRLALLSLTRRTLAEGMEILGIEPVDRM